MSNIEHTKTKSTSVSSISSNAPISELKPTINDNSSIPIASIKKNFKLTLGEIQEVHNCTLIDNKLAFIVTLRATNSIAKVFRNDINTNSLRHAVPFSSLCNKHGCKNVNELEEKLIQNNDNSNIDTDNIPTIEISCDSSVTSLKQLANIASVVSGTNNDNNHDNDSDDSTDSEKTQEKSTITYNLRSKKRKFRDMNDEDNKSVSDKSIYLTTNNSIDNNNNNNNGKNTKVKNKYKRPQFLRPIAPNTVSCGPSLSPKKLLNDLDINSIKKTVSAPNTPVLNNNRQIINLINSPSTKTLQFPQINLGQNHINHHIQQITNQNQGNNNIPPNVPLLPNINGLNNGLSGINNINIQQLAQMLLQKQLQNNYRNNNGVITKITQLNPIHMLPKLESETETQMQMQTNLNEIMLKEPSLKRLKLLNGNCMRVNHNNNNGDNNNNNQETQPFWTERLRLDGILNTHKVCEKQMNDLDSMRNWTHIIRTLQGQRVELLKVRNSIQLQYQTCLMEANRYHLVRQELCKHNEPKTTEYKQLKLKIDEYKKQITEIYSKISKLSVKRKVFEKQLQSANHQINKCQINMKQINKASTQYNNIIFDRKEKATKLVEFMKTIDVISKQYCKSVENMQQKVEKFEPDYAQWNSGEVVTWFENINKGLLNTSQSFLLFKKQLITNNVNGKDLINLNNFSLKMMGLKNDKERNIIIKYLNKLINNNENIEDPNDSDNKSKDIISEKHISENESDNDNDNEENDNDNDGE